MKYKFFSMLLTLALLGGAICPVYAAPINSANTYTFLDSGQRIPNLFSSHTAFGDLDGDHDLDIYETRNGADHIWLNDGKGNFTDSDKTVNDGNTYTLDVKLADVDGDGDLDSVLAKEDQNLVLFNDGKGNFTKSDQLIKMVTGFTNIIALGDLDGDGDVDAYFVNGALLNKHFDEIWLNNGNGIFTDTLQRLDNDTTYNIALGDVDSDQDLDVMETTCGQFDEPDRLWLNNGAGTFTDSGQTFDSTCTVPLIVQDLDGDKDLDLIIGKTGSDRGTFAFWKNNGAGQFTKAVTFTGDVTPLAGDIDGDQDVDIVASDGTVLLNDGQGNFTKSAQSLPTDVIFLFDLNGDGKLDLVRNTNNGGQIWLQINPTGEEQGVSRSFLPFIPR